MQLFLIFEDDTYFEIYSDSQLSASKGVDKGGMETVRKYVGDNVELVFEQELDPKTGSSDAVRKLVKLASNLGVAEIQILPR